MSSENRDFYARPLRDESPADEYVSCRVCGVDRPMIEMIESRSIGYVCPEKCYGVAKERQASAESARARSLRF